MTNIVESLAQLNENIDLALGGLKGKVNDQAVAVQRESNDPIYMGDVVRYTLPSYDTVTAPQPTASHGSVTIEYTEVIVAGRGTGISQHHMEFTAPSNYSGEVTLSIGSRAWKVNVETQRIAKPAIVSLNDGQVDVPAGYNITASPFESKPAGLFLHSSTDWEFATDAEFTNVVWSYVGEGEDLTTIPVPAVLDDGETYHVRVRYVDSGDISGHSAAADWSDAVAFSIARPFVAGNEVQALSAATTRWPGDQFGFHISIDGNRAAVSSPSSELAGNNAGAVHIIEQQGGTWVEVEWTASGTPITNSAFGHQVLLKGNALFVAAPGLSDTYVGGAMHVFAEQPDGSFMETQKLVSSTGIAGFGKSIAISPNGQWLAVGAPFADHPHTNAGSVVLFENQSGTWIESTTLYLNYYRPNTQIGFSVAMTDSHVFVGSSPASGCAWGGCVVRFDLTDGAWSLGTTITPSDGHVNDKFGSSIALDGDDLIVGAWGNSTLGSDAGAVYHYGSVTTAPVELNKYMSGLAAPSSDRFGVQVSTDGNTLAIGAPGYNGARGAVSIYHKQPDGLFLHIDDVWNADVVGSTWFGYNGLVVQAGMLLVGTPAIGAGSVYAFT